MTAPEASVGVTHALGDAREKCGEMTIHLRDGDVALRAGEMFVVPRGVEHKPSAIQECRMMLIEPAGTPNTGDAPSDRTAADNVWV